MTLRFRTILAVSIAILAALVALFFVIRHVVADGYLAVEQRASEVNTQRALQAIDRELTSIKRVTRDYARWDETYRFVGDSNPGFLQSSLGANTYANYGLDMVVIYNDVGRVIYQATYSAQTNNVVDGAQSLLAYITANQTGSNGQFITRHTNAEDGISGMILLPEGVMMIATEPILPSNGEGIITGTIVMGRYLDALELERLADQIRLPLDMAILDNTALPFDFAEANQALEDGDGNLLPMSFDDEMTSRYAPLVDILGRRIAILRIETPRDAYVQSQETQRWLAVTFGVGGFAVILLMVGVVYLAVGRRLVSLYRSIRSIREKDDLSYRISVKGKDEFAALVGEINRLLAALDQSSQELSDAKGFQQQLSQAQHLRLLTRTIIPTRSVDDIVHALVAELGDKFGYYYVGVFLLDEARLYAVLQAGTGNVVPAGYRLTVGGSSTIGMAISRRQIQKVEVGSRKEQTSFTRLPMARSEAAIPIRFEHEVLGAIAIQSTQPSAFDKPEDQETLQYIADYIGIVLTTTRLIDELRDNYYTLEKRYQQFLSERWVEELRLRPVLGYTYEQENEISSKATCSRLDVPIVLDGVAIGKVEIDSERANWSSEDRELVDALLAQTSQALENARVLERSQRRAAQERLVAEIIRSVRSSTSVDSILSASVLELGRLLRAAKAEVRIQPGASAVLLERIQDGGTLAEEAGSDLPLPEKAPAAARDEPPHAQQTDADDPQEVAA
ncbi:MAG: CHASE4 domain-containing protein [Chloroflexota bacterium]